MKTPGKTFTMRAMDDGTRLATRLVSCMKAGTFEMETLCRLAGIKTTTRIPTAAVECTQRPRLLLNPDFVGRHCERDEHLLLLVMHELWHVLLAHTRLYPRVTMAHNIAFDAIINAGLARLFAEPEYRGFFEAINPADKFPHMLLRPPVGWPAAPQYPEDGTDNSPAGTRRMLQLLYPEHGRARWSMPLYEEILALLLQYAAEHGLVVPLLLGDHDPNSREGQVLNNPLFGDMLRRMVKNWPQSPIPMGQRSGGSEGYDWLSAMGPSSEQARRAFADLLRRTLTTRHGTQQRRSRSSVPETTGVNVLPNARDRLAPARKAVGGPGTLWAQPGHVRARVPQTPARAFVYLDVSGSMERVLPHLLGLLVPYVINGEADVYQFSTIVEHLPLVDLRDAKLKTSGGTDINCVLAHVVEVKPAVHKILVLTDGYTGTPSDQLADRLREQQIRMYVVMPFETHFRDDLEGISTTMTILPAVWGRAS